MRTAKTCLFFLLALSACQVPLRETSRVRSPVCPRCETVTRTTPLKGVTYTRHLCPTCGRYAGPDWYEDVELGGRVYGYGGESLLQEKVLVCDRCNLVVGECSECRN